MLVRKQIVLPSDIDRRIRRIASAQGTSQSAVIADAVRRLPDPEQDVERLIDFPGITEGPEVALSEQVDAVLYGA
jgi:predicted transcriptional regulator